MGMITVHKFPLSMKAGIQEVQMPGAARILKIDLQHGEPMIWALVNDGIRILEPRKFIVIGTGHPLLDGCMADADNYRHIDTVQAGHFVWHFFEIVEEQ